jgi:hypothetical protein
MYLKNQDGRQINIDDRSMNEFIDPNNVRGIIGIDILVKGLAYVGHIH